MAYVEAIPGTRLGNWLFSCAVAASVDEHFAVQTTADYIVRAFKANPLLCHIPIIEHFPERCRSFHENLSRYEKIPYSEGEDLALYGYFQNARYLDEARVRKLYAWPDDFVARVRERFQDVLSRPDVTAIHVRRGDYLAYPIASRSSARSTSGRSSRQSSPRFAISSSVATTSPGAVGSSTRPFPGGGSIMWKAARP